MLFVILGGKRVSMDNKKYSFVDKTGNVVLSLDKYDYVDTFENGYARLVKFNGYTGAIKKNAKVWYIDKQGNLVVPLKYSVPTKKDDSGKQISDYFVDWNFKDDLAGVNVDGKWDL